jgi:hypothetical protein
MSLVSTPTLAQGAGIALGRLGSPHHLLQRLDVQDGGGHHDDAEQILVAAGELESVGAAQRDAAHHDLLTALAEVGQSMFGGGQPVVGPGDVEVLDTGAVTSDPRHRHGEPAASEVVGQRADISRRASEPVQQQAAWLAALEEVATGARHEWSWHDFVPPSALNRGQTKPCAVSIGLIHGTRRAEHGRVQRNLAQLLEAGELDRHLVHLLSSKRRLVTAVLDILDPGPQPSSTAMAALGASMPCVSWHC